MGSFRLTLTSDRQTLAIGEAATVRVRVEGDGNLKWVEHGPDLRVVGAKVYPPQAKNDLKTGPTGMEPAAVPGSTWSCRRPRAS